MINLIMNNKVKYNLSDVALPHPMDFISKAISYFRKKIFSA